MRELANYNYYNGEFLGTIIPSNSFKRKSREATTLINLFTRNKINSNNINDNIRDLCCEISELLYNQEKLINSTLNNDKTITSETVGPITRHYETNSNSKIQKILSKKELKEECYNICYKYLAYTNFLYLGIN